MANAEHINNLKKGVDFWNRWRKEIPDIRPELSEADITLKNLSGINFNRTDLSRANLSRANLTAATLRDANLSRADLINANLSGADFYGVNLSNANLSGTDLSGANFSRAELFGTNLTQAILTDTKFEQTKIGVTIFANVDLSQALYLDTVRYRGPSTIGIDTFYQSQGKIPEEFLKGCGVPEEFVTYARSLTVNPSEFYSCFISYSHVDKVFAHRLYEALQSTGIRCWLDDHELLPGEDIHDEVERGVRLWDKVLLCASRSSLKSWWVDKELTTAFDKEALLWKERNKKVLILIPLNLDGYLFSGKWQSGKATTVTSRMAADFTGWESDNKKFEEQLELVIRTLRSDGHGKPPPPKSKL